MSLLILLGVSMIIYFLIRLMPVDFIQSKIDAISRGGATVSQETQDAMYAMYGLGDDSFLGILKGYFSWLGALAKFDLGTSFVYGLPVAQVIFEHMGISFAIALELSYEETQRLLASVGFVLSDSSLFDVIIKYCLENKIYDVFEIDSALFKYDQETLFSKF